MSDTKIGMIDRDFEGARFHIMAPDFDGAGIPLEIQEMVNDDYSYWEEVEELLTAEATRLEG